MPKLEIEDFDERLIKNIIEEIKISDHFLGYEKETNIYWNNSLLEDPFAEKKRLIMKMRAYCDSFEKDYKAYLKKYGISE